MSGLAEVALLGHPIFCEKPCGSSPCRRRNSFGTPFANRFSVSSSRTRSSSCASTLSEPCWPWPFFPQRPFTRTRKSLKENQTIQNRPRKLLRIHLLDSNRRQDQRLPPLRRSLLPSQLRLQHQLPKLRRLLFKNNLQLRTPLRLKNQHQHLPHQHQSQRRVPALLRLRLRNHPLRCRHHPLPRLLASNVRHPRRSRE